MQSEGHITTSTTYSESGDDAILQWRLALSQGTYLTYLNSIDLSAMNDNDVVLYLSSLLLELYERNDSTTYDDKLLDDVLNTFDPLRPPFTRATPLYIVLISLPGIDLTAVSWVWMRKSVDILTVLLDLIAWLPNEQAPVIMPKVLNIFLRTDLERPYELLDNPSRDGSLATLVLNDTIAYLMDQAYEKGNDGMWGVLRDAYSVNAPQVQPGPWLLDTRPTSSPSLPRPYVVGTRISEETQSMLDQTIPKPSRLGAEMIIWSDVGICDSKTRREVYGVMDNRYLSLEEEMELFRRYGPSNTFIVDESDDDLEPGADRMLLCDRYNYDEEDEIDTPIYTGICDWKGHSISGERAALRMPVIGGGWSGSYCSALCIKERLEDMRETEMSSVEVDAVVGMVDSMMQQLLDWGLYAKAD